jgi:nucleotide-binding universal stress UspA family protein
MSAPKKEEANTNTNTNTNVNVNTKRILVPVDLADKSRFVLHAACELAQAMGATAKLRLLHVLPERVAGEAPAPNLFEPAGDSYARISEAERLLSNWQDEMVPPDNQGGVIARISAHPWTAICEEAESYGADTIVVGAHRYGFLERALGTTAAKVVNHVNRQVYVVRPSASAAPPAAVAKKTKNKPGKVPADKTGVPETPQFAIFEASALAGITGGAALGALAGPPGMIIGGTIGAAVGLLAGSVLDIEEQRTSKHDHELDDDIGVTKGDLGAKEMARAHLMDQEQGKGEAVTREEGASDAVGSTTVALNKEATKLQVEHERLEKLYEALLDSYRQGEWSDVAAQWRKFEPAILAHLAFEEAHVFPIFRQINEQEADLLLREHNELRERLTTLGMNIDLHALPHTDAEELVRRLRVHGKREEQILYPWIDLILVGGKRTAA